MRADLRKQLEGEILCTCSCRRPMNDCPMEPNCHGLDAQRAKLDKYVVDQGMDRDQVLAAFASDYGTQAILARPIDKGFNRLAWLFPYLVGIAGACRRGGDRAALVAPRRREPQPAAARQTTPRCAPDWTMSSATSIDGTDAERRRPRTGGRHQRLRRAQGRPEPVEGRHTAAVALLPAALAGGGDRRGGAWRARARPEHLVLISLTIGAAGFAGAALYRTLAPLVGQGRGAAGRCA